MGVHLCDITFIHNFCYSIQLEIMFHPSINLLGIYNNHAY